VTIRVSGCAENFLGGLAHEGVIGHRDRGAITVHSKHVPTPVLEVSRTEDTGIAEVLVD
jgi:hypothetical protein